MKTIRTVKHSEIKRLKSKHLWGMSESERIMQTWKESAVSLNVVSKQTGIGHNRLICWKRKVQVLHASLVNNIEWPAYDESVLHQYDSNSLRTFMGDGFVYSDPSASSLHEISMIFSEFWETILTGTILFAKGIGMEFFRENFRIETNAHNYLKITNGGVMNVLPLTCLIQKNKHRTHFVS